jgi:malate dehydrogenase (oxaloacetate-decarboxylating)
VGFEDVPGEATQTALTEEQVSALRSRALDLHRTHRGKIEVISKVPVRNQDDLTLAYTPGVAEVCREIRREPGLSFELTTRANLVAVVTDGTAVLGLGDIGPSAALPVMEGKSVLFKTFAGVDALPLCIDGRLGGDPVEAVVAFCRAIEPTFGGINLEDIGAPNCFEIERRLRETLDIPVFHDDQHGSAIVTTAALINALRVVDKRPEAVKVVINGAGAAGVATARMLRDLGVVRTVLCDRAGAIHRGRSEHMDGHKAALAQETNPDGERGSLADVMRGADVFIGVSVGGVVDEDMVRSMAPRAVVMAMANPEPEIHPAEAARAGAQVVCTGRMDYPNQINNVAAFPGVFRGALDVRARRINEEMKMAAARAIAGLVPEEELARGTVMPLSSDARVAPAVAAAVARAAVATGVARSPMDPAAVAERTRALAGRAGRLNAGGTA